MSAWAAHLHAGWPRRWRTACQVAGLWLLALVLSACGGGREAAEPPAGAGLLVKAASPVDASLTGTYWSPFEPGTGFFFEAQGDLGVVTFYVFDAQGRPEWYSGAGSLRAAATGYEFTAVLSRFTGGQPGSSATPRTPAAASGATATIQFSVSGAAQVRVAGRSFTGYRFSLSAAQLPAVPADQRAAVQPETGIYWNPQQSGRGYTLEMINGVANLGVFHYADSGEPTWNLVAVGLPASGAAAGEYAAYRGGQTLDGAYAAATRVPGSATFQVRPLTACSMEVAFPGGAPFEIQRFSFNPAAQACRGATTTDPSLGTSGVSLQGYVAAGPLGQALQSTPVAQGVLGKTTRYTVAAGSLPPGLALDATTGVVTGVPKQAGSFAGEVSLQVQGLPGEIRAPFNFAIRGLGLAGPQRITVRPGESVPQDLRYVLVDGVTGQPVDFAPGFGATFTTSTTPAFSGPQLAGGLYLRSDGRVMGPPTKTYAGTVKVTANIFGAAAGTVMPSVDVALDVLPGLSGPLPGVRYLQGISVSLDGPSEFGATQRVGTLPPSVFRFRATGAIEKLAGATLAIVAEDPMGLYEAGQASVAIDLLNATATVTLRPKPFAAAGRVQGYLRFFACLDAQCSTLLAPTPLVVSYGFDVL